MHIWMVTHYIKQEHDTVVLHSIHTPLYTLYLHNGINRTGLLAKATVYTLCHVNIVSCGSSAAISSRFRFNCNGLRVLREERRKEIMEELRERGRKEK